MPTDDDKLNARIRRYVAGEMEPEELQNFERDLTTKPELKDDVDLYIAMTANFNAEQKLRLKSLAREHNLRPQIPIPEEEEAVSSDKKRGKVVDLSGSRRTSRGGWKLPAAAAILVFALLGGIWFSQMGGKANPEHLAMSYLDTPFEAPTKVMGEASNSEALWQAAVTAYEQESYGKVVTLIEQLQNKGVKNQENQFYLGIARLQKNPADPKGAIEALSSARKLNPTMLQQEIDWYLGIAYLLGKDKVAAKAQLDKIVQNKAWHWKDAEKLLQQF